MWPAPCVAEAPASTPRPPDHLPPPTQGTGTCCSEAEWERWVSKQFFHEGQEGCFVSRQKSQRENGICRHVLSPLCGFLPPPCTLQFPRARRKDRPSWAGWKCFLTTVWQFWSHTKGIRREFEQQNSGYVPHLQNPGFLGSLVVFALSPIPFYTAPAKHPPFTHHLLQCWRGCARKEAKYCRGCEDFCSAKISRAYCTRLSLRLKSPVLGINTF